MKKKTLCLALALLTVLAMLAGCGTPASSSAAAEPAAEPAASSSAAASEPAATDSGTADAGAFKVAMVTDVGGINDESFNQSAWTGMEQLQSEFGAEVSFIESTKDADYAPNLEKATDEGNDMVWGIGFLMKDAVTEAATANPDQMYALVDESWADGEMPNAIGVMFKAEESSFLVGYAAALKTETNRVGLVLGMESPVMDRFTNGYRAGVAWGAHELGKEITVDYAVAEAFDDPAKGKALAQKMYTDGCDIVYAVAGFTGTGCIEAAKELDKWVCGVDLDQNYLAPENLICSGLKNVGAGVYGVTQRVMDGEELGGTTVWMGITEGGAGIAMTGGLLGADIEEKVQELEHTMVAGDMEIPYDAAMLETFVADLPNQA